MENSTGPGQVSGPDSTVRVWLRMVVAPALLLSMATACGGGEAADTTAPPEEPPVQTREGGGVEAGVTVTEAPTEPSAESAEDDIVGDEPETLAEYLGYGFDDPDAAAARVMEVERRVQELIARCMAGEGFEYIPAVRTVSASQVAFDQEEFARERGFGITTWLDDEDPFGFEEDDWVDPNAAIVEGLSDSEREAYYEVLRGTFDEFGSGEVDPETGEPAPADDPYGGGCEGRAYEEVYGAQTDVWEQLGPQIEEMTQRIYADPRFQEANKEWAVCMSDRGYPYESIEQMYEDVIEDFQSRLDEILGEGGGFADPFEGWTEEETESFMAEKSNEEIQDFFEQAQQQEREDIDQDALSALQQEERDLAVAAFGCQEAMVDSIEELRQEYEGRFIRENRDVLEQLRR